MTVIKRLDAPITGDVSRYPLYQPGTGISGVTHRWRAASLTAADGTAVASWAPVVGSISLNATATTSTRPTVRVDSDGTRFLRFDGVDDYLPNPSSAFTEANLKTIIIVARHRTGSDADASGEGLAGLGGGSAQWNDDVSPKNVRAFWLGSGGNKAIAANVDLGTGLHLMAFIGDRVGGNFGVMVDGADGTVTSAGSGTFSGNTTIQLGAYAGSQYGTWDVAEVIAVDHAITIAERDALRLALRATYPALV